MIVCFALPDVPLPHRKPEQAVFIPCHQAVYFDTGKTMVMHCFVVRK